MFDEFGNPIGDYSGGSYDPGAPGGYDPYLGDSGDVGSGDTGFLPVQFGGLGGLTGSLTRGGMSAMRGVARRGGAIVTAAGRKISTTKAYQLMRQWGPEIAAGALGMSIADLIAVLFDSGALTRRRRRRGISSRDIRTASRVVRFVNRMQHQLGCVTRSRSFGGRHAHRVTNVRR